MSLDLVVAVDARKGIGIGNKLAWRLPGDMKYFQELTSKTTDTSKSAPNAVIMGRKTWESIPSKFRPLPQRLNIILTRNPSYAASVPSGVCVCRTLDEAISVASQKGSERVFVIGGAEVYRQTMAHANCGRLYLTQLQSAFDCDVFFPQYESEFQLLTESQKHEENGIEYTFQVFEKR